jgi:hypothetical protein
LTVTVKEQLALLPAASVAVQWTVVMPSWKRLPLAGLQFMLGFPQLSLAEAAYVTTAPHWPESLFTTMSPWQWAAGGSVSFTVTLKWHVAVLSAASVVMQVTVVVPFGKTLPLGGVQLVVGLGQLSVALTV